MHFGTKDTLFNLIFGKDVVILMKIKINTLRVRHFDPNLKEDNIRTNLDLQKEVRDEASIRVVARQRQVAQYYNKRVRHRQFREGDLVLRKCQASKLSTEQKKLSSNWEGPYLISTVVGRGGHTSCRPSKAKKYHKRGMPNT